MEKLHPGAKWIFRVKAYIGYCIIMFGFLLPITISFLVKEATWTYLIYFVIGWLTFLFIIGEIYARMAYNRWFYEFTPTELKLERGVVWKKYSNIPYERIQNIDIHRGIIARMIGFSTIDIQTAGFHAYGKYGTARSEGHIPAVSIKAAEKIREFLMKKISKKNQGL